MLTSTTLTGNTGLQRKRPSGVSGLNASNNSIGNITSSSSQLIGNTNSLINTDSSCTNLTGLGVAGGANTGASISSGDICASLNSASNTANTALVSWKYSLT